MHDFLRKLEQVEEKYGTRVCIHEWLEGGGIELTVYRIINSEDQRKIPLPFEMQKELNNLLILEYSRRLKERIKIIIGIGTSYWLPFRLALEGLTKEEIERNQRSWNTHCACMDMCS